MKQYAALDDTVYFWFAANDTSGSGGDGATPAADVRLAGAAAAAAPVYSPTPVLLSHANYPAGAYEIAIAATAANGFAANNTYAVFCTLAIDAQNPTGFVGSFDLKPVEANAKLLGGTAQTGNDVGADVNDILTDTGTTLDALIKDIPTVAEFGARSILAANYVLTSDTIAGVTAVTNDVGITQAGADKVWGTAARALTDKAGFALSTAGITSIWEKNISAFAGAGYAGTYLKTLYDDWLNGGRLDLIIDAILADTGEIGVAGAGLTDLGGMATGMKAEIESECNDALVALKLDHLIAVADADDAVNDSIIAKLASSAATADWSTFVNTTDALQAIRDRGDAAWTTGAGGSDRLLMVDTTIATLASQTSFTLTAGSADDDAYNNATIVIEDASTATQKAIGLISNYAGATKTITLKFDPGIFTMATTDKVYILAENALKATLANRQLNVAADGDIAGNVDGAVGSVTADVGITQAGADKVWGTAARALTDKAGFALSSAAITAIFNKDISAYSGAGYAGTYLKNLYDNQGNWITATGFATSGALITAQNDLDIITGASGVVIQDGTIIAASLGADCITNAKIADNAIAVENIKDSAISAAKIATDSITATKIAANAIGSSEFAQAAADKVRASVCVTGDPANSIGKILHEIYANRLTSARAGYLANINNANLATIADISTLTSTEIAYLNASISSRSSHAASAIWSVGTRALTDKAGFALSAAGITAIWEKNISAYSGAGYAGTYLKNLYDNQGNWLTATGFSTHNAAAVWSAGSRALSTPADYKADVSALALEATLTAIKGASFLTGTDSLEALRNRGDSAWITGAGGDATATNQTTIINHLTDVKGTNFVKDTHSLKQILDLIQRTLGLTQENHYIDNTTFTSDKLTAARIRIYSVAGSVGTAADVIATYNIAATYDADGNMETYKVTKA